MRANITAGDCLNEKLEKPCEVWITFREAMIRGSYSTPLFSPEFCRERSHALGVTEAEYFEKFTPFLDFIGKLEKYDEVALWFGTDDFCIANRATVIQGLRELNYVGQVISYTVNEDTAEILRTEHLNLF